MTTPQELATRHWDEMAGEWDDLAPGYAAGLYRLLLSREEDVVATLLRMPDAVVVDFGCGTGLLTEKLQRVCSQVLAVDASANMIRVVKEKIRSCEWENVKAVSAVIGKLEGDPIARQVIQDWEGTVDIVIASSVMSYIPSDDLEATMKVIGRLLKPDGIFCHSDWPDDSEHELCMSQVNATQMYAMASFGVVSIDVVTISVGGGESANVLIGVARKDEWSTR